MRCLYVRLSRSYILSKRINISSKKISPSDSGSHTILVFYTKRHGSIATGIPHPLTGALNAGGVSRNRDSEPVSDIERVTQATLLGIDITSTLSTAARVCKRMLLPINQRLYLSSQLKSQLLKARQLRPYISYLLILSKITYEQDKCNMAKDSASRRHT